MDPQIASLCNVSTRDPIRSKYDRAICVRPLIIFENRDNWCPIDMDILYSCMVMIYIVNIVIMMTMVLLHPTYQMWYCDILSAFYRSWCVVHCVIIIIVDRWRRYRLMWCLIYGSYSYQLQANLTAVPSKQYRDPIW